jgi:general secretion pathway protein D
VNRAPPQATIQAKFVLVPEAVGQAITQGALLASSDPTNQLRVLTEPQARALTRDLESAAGVDSMAVPQVTTLSGRQAQMQIAEIRSILTGIDPRVLAQPGRTAKDVTNTSPFLTEAIPLGPVLNLKPEIADDGVTVHLKADATVAEFLGYETPTNTVVVFVNGKRQEVEPPRPQLRTREVRGEGSVYDGQTLVMIGLPMTETYRFEDKVPGLGDLPLLGRLFRRQGTATQSKQLVVLITPTIIDPAGNRVHTDDNSPFDPASIPPQVR